MERKTKDKKGISLIVLVITIIVMIILATTIIISLNNNEIIQNAKNTVDLSNEQQVQEMLEITVALLKQENKLDETNLKEELTKNFNEEVEVTKDTDGSYTVGVKETYFTIEDGKIIKGKYDKWDGTSTKPTNMTDNEIYIYKASELKWLQEQVAEGNLFENYTIYLENNLDLGARESAGDTIEAKWKTEANKLVKWTPIGKTSDLALKAKFEGNEHIIKGVYVEETTKYNGIFGYVKNIIQNLSIKNSYIEGAEYTGGIVGYSANDIINCHNIDTTVVLIAGEYRNVGGIVGSSFKNIINCTNSGNIIAYGKDSNEITRCGGIVGYNKGENITNCVNNGNIESSGGYTAGIAGQSWVNISECVNNGKVTGTGLGVAGISGFMRGNMSSCINNGNITAIKRELVAGIAGAIYPEQNSEIKNCINNGKIYGKSYIVAGIIGQSGKLTTIINCTNNASIIGEDCQVAGICGYNKGKIISCCNKGDIKAKKRESSTFSNAGGISSVNLEGTTIEKCINFAKVEATGDYVGGIVGQLKKSSILKLCYNKGSISGASCVGSIVGDNEGECTYNHLYYLSSLNLGAINGEDIVEQNVTSTTKDINTFEEFKTWIAQFETE